MPRTAKIENVCGRCGRKEEETIDLAKALELEEVDERRDAADQALETTLNETLDQDCPDIVVAVRTADGSYSVKGLRNLCDQPAAKRNKGCATRVKALLDDVFMAPKAKPKKPKTPPAEDPKTPATEGVKGKGTKKK